MTPAGTWDLTIATPIGTQRATIQLSTTDGTLHGTAHDQRHSDPIALTDIAVDGNHVTWRQSITKPLRLNLTFDVTIDGDRLTGTAKAGRLPGSKVTGHRVTPS
jgi:hypothetical protein